MVEKGRDTPTPDGVLTNPLTGPQPVTGLVFALLLQINEVQRRYLDVYAMVYLPDDPPLDGSLEAENMASLGVKISS